MPRVGDVPARVLHLFDMSNGIARLSKSGRAALGTTGAGAEMDSVTELFHRVNRLLPEEQQVRSIPLDTKVSEALSVMATQHYSQIPVMEGSSVLGLFTYRSFALGITRMECGQGKPGDITVEEFIEKPDYTTVNDEFSSLFRHLDDKDVVLVGDSERLQGILTAMDLARYLYKVANAFVLLQEIELALRALIRLAVDEDELRTCVENALSHSYQPDKLPTQLEDMTFNDYVQLVGDGRNWKSFKPVFGGTRERLRARLEPIRDLRNDIFHFKREITVGDHQNLADCRDWLLIRARAAEAKQEGERRG